MVDLSEATKLVYYWAHIVAKSCSGLEVCDIRQDLWVECVKAMRNFDSSRQVSLTTYLYPTIRWRSLAMIKQHAIYYKDLNKYAAINITKYTLPQNKSMQTVANRVQNRLNKTAQKVFDVYTAPPEDLVVDLSGDFKVKTEHIAMYLGVSTSCIRKSLQQIKRAIEKVSCE